MKYFFSMLLFLLMSVVVLFQTNKVFNVTHRSIDDRVEIFYDLPPNSDTLVVKAYLKKSSEPAFRYRLKHVAGKIGTGVFSGKRNKITWYYKKEPAHLFTGSGFYYEVVAENKSPVK